MQKQVLYRDRQEFQAADPNHAQDYTAQTFGDLVTDAVASDPKYAGFGVTEHTATEVTVAAGRYYNGGVIYVAESETNKSLFSVLPVATKKIVAITVWGDTVDTDVEPRDFLVDLTSGETEPQAVAMTRHQQAVVDYVAGLESASPQPPTVAGAQTTVALVTLNTTGIESIEMQTDNRLPQSQRVDLRLKTVEGWKDQAEPRITSISSDLAALAERTAGLADREAIINVASDLANLRQELSLPDSVINWDTDHFLDDEKSDDTGAGYTCITDAGLRPGHAGASVAPFDLLSPSDPAVSRSAADLVLPLHTHERRLQTIGFAGSVPINQYPAYAWTWYPYRWYGWRWHWGWAWPYNTYYWNTIYGGYYARVRPVNYRTGRVLVQYFDPIRRYWRYKYTYIYELGSTPASQTGSMLAQTFLNANAMWLTRVGLHFTSVQAGHDITVMICECDAGKPDLTKVVTTTTLAADDAAADYGTETQVELEPSFLEAGQRYAVVLVSAGAHSLAVVSGAQYTQGTLFFGTDGEYLAGDLTKDLMFSLYGAKFTQTRTEVSLNAVELAGGMTDIDLEVEQHVPEGTELTWEVQINGVWRDLSASGANLSAASPSLLPMRAVFTNTTDMAPAFRANTTGLQASRPGTSLVHWSAERTLDSASDNIEVRLLIDGYDSDEHTITVTLEDGGTTYTADSVTTKPEADATRMSVIFTPEDGTGITTYQIKITATLSGAVRPFTIIERTDVAV
jgi:hypothetical protein